MTWILIAIALMIISFTANVMMTEHCEHDWEDMGGGSVRCSKCKQRSSNRFRNNTRMRSEA